MGMFNQTGSTMCPLMQVYREIRLYGVIEYDSDYSTSAGWHRYMIIRNDDGIYAVTMLNGDVLKIEAVG